MRNSTFATILVLSWISLVLLSLSTAASAANNGFTKSKVVGGLSVPTAMEFAPDGRLFVSEKSGTLRVITSGVLLPTPFVDLSTTTDSAGERGFLGIAFDPNFASNHYVYLYHTVKGSPPHNRVSRFTANGDVALSGSEAVVLDLEGLGPTNHNGGAIHFGIDGKLYVNVGENGNGYNAQSISNRLGKILRIEANGTIPADNPTSFPGISGTTSGANRAIWAVGFRNPYTSGFNPVTGRIFVNDVGQSAREEIDDLLKGMNYGWNNQEGFLGTDNVNYTRPIIDYVHGDSGACAITGGVFYHPPTNTFGNSYLDKYFYADYCGGWVRMLDPATKVTTTFDTGNSQPVDLKVGSDGALYVLAIGTGEVWKLQGTSQTPQAILVSTTAMRINESKSGTFTVMLAAQPSANVVVNIARRPGDPSVTMNPASLTFTSTDWNSPKTVTVSSLADTKTINVSATVTCSSSGLTPKDVAVTVIDSTATPDGPIAEITLPHNGDVVLGTNADFFGNNIGGAVTNKAEFYIDGALKYTDVTDQPPNHYHFGGGHGLWNTTLLSNGSHTLAMKVYEKGGVRTSTHQITVTTSTTWSNIPFASQSGNFNLTLNATPNMNNANIVIGLSKAQAAAYTDLAAIVRFNNTGTIDVRNGGAYSSAVTVAYSAGTTYKIRMVVSIPTHKYSVYVTPPGKSEILLASNYAFRTEQASVTSLGNVGEFGNPGYELINIIQVALSN
jgi:glucose/arabinose dehydrogenase